MSATFPIAQLKNNLALSLSFSSFFLEGEEVQRWSNGMFSNNIRKLKPDQGNYSAICDDRGRVQGFLYLFCLEKEKFLCVLDGISSEAFLKRFQMYMILDDIELEETELHLFHCFGENIEAILSSKGILTPANGNILEFDEGFIFQSKRLGTDGYDILHRKENWLENLQDIKMISETEADAIRIFHGRAKWPQDGTDKSMIHELNLNEECCAFDKGCYVGQEIINRLDVKGLINKKLHRLELVEGDPVTEDDTIVLFKDEKKMGSISSFTSISENGKLRHLGLGTIRKNAWEKDTLLQSSGGQIWKIL